MEKADLRRVLQSRIRRLPVEARSNHAAAIRRHLSEDEGFRSATTVFAYLALPGEPDLALLIEAFPEKRWCASRITPEGRIVFHHLPHLAEALPGSLGIRQPDPFRHPEVAPSEAELILVPGLGFDPQTRARLGRGKGHYDRFLESALSHGRKPTLTGVLFSTQLASIPVESHDVPMDRLVTELGWI